MNETDLNQRLWDLWQIRKEDREPAIKVLLTLYKNILSNPNNPKFRDLNFSKIRRKFENAKPAFYLLYTAGFSQDVSGQRLQLNPANIKMLEATNAGLEAKIANPNDPILFTKLIPKSQQQQQMHVQKQKQDKTPQHFEEKPQAGNSYEYKNFNDKKSNENSYDYKTDSKVKYLNWKNANMYQNDDNKTRSQKPLSMSGILHELTYEIEQNNISNVQLWLAINIKYKPAKEKLKILDEPCLQACYNNNVGILQLLLEYGANPNAINYTDGTQATTMYIAAMNENVAMMILLIKHGFDCKKLINNIEYDDTNNYSVFLELCANGNVQCMDYLINQCKLKNAQIDIYQRDIDGRNGLYIAVQQEKVSMVSYLLNSVYNDPQVKRNIINQRIQTNGLHLCEIAADKTSGDGLSIFRLLTQHKCPINNHAIAHAASFSPLIFDFMLTERYYPDLMYLTDEVMYRILLNAPRSIIFENIQLIVKHLVKQQTLVNNHEIYQQCIINVFYYIMINGSYDAYFNFIKQLICIILNTKHWKHFLQSKLIDKSFLLKLLNKLMSNEDINVDKLWCQLVIKMNDSLDNNDLLNEYHDNDDDVNESKQNDNFGHEACAYYCNKKHLMVVRTIKNDKHTATKGRCNICGILSVALDYECDKCSEYICHNCINTFDELNKMLRMKQFDKFNKWIEKCNNTSRQLFDLILILFLFKLCKHSIELLYWIWNCKIVLPFYNHENEANATRLSLIYLFENGSNINTIFNQIPNKFVKNETLFNMMDQNTHMSPEEQIRFLIDYKFDFEKLINIYDNIEQMNGLIRLTTIYYSYSSIKLLIDHCKTLRSCNIDIAHCDVNGYNALFHSSSTDIKQFSYLLSNVCFPNNNLNNTQGQIALNQKNKHGKTIAHYVASKPMPHIVDTFKLLKKYNFNFNTYDCDGRLPIHWACASNNHLLLSWIINENENINIFGNDIINEKTKCAKNDTWNGYTPLSYAVSNNSTECVNVLSKQPNIHITEQNVKNALHKDSVSVLKLLLCGLFAKYQISKWDDIEKSASMISTQAIQAKLNYCSQNTKEKCYSFLLDLYMNGYLVCDYKYIVLHLDYDIKTVMNKDNIIDVDETKQDSEGYDILDVLGKGSFGLVKLGENKKTKEKAAIKYINLSKRNMEIQFITTEIESLKKMKTNENIIKLLDYKIDIVNNNLVTLYFEYCGKGELYLLLQQCDCLSLRISFAYFLQLLNGIRACHNLNIVHRDLKLQNIFLSNTFQLKIGDFGLAHIVHHNKDNNDNNNNANETIYNVGTKLYRAPELLEHAPSTQNIEVLKSCDVFSLSIIFWQMINGVRYYPFELINSFSIKQANYKYIKYGNYDKFWHIHKKCNIFKNDNNSNKHQQSSKDVQLLCNLFEQMFDYDPYSRISIDKIYKHEWIKQKSDNLSFKMNNSQLESYVRDIYNKTTHSPADKHNIQSKVSSIKSSTKNTLTISNTGTSIASSSSASSGNNTNYLRNAIDSSRAESDYVLENKELNVLKPIVIMVGIGKYQNGSGLKDKCGVLKDYSNTKSMLNDIKKYPFIYKNSNNEIMHDKIDEDDDDGKENKENKDNKDNDKLRKDDFCLEWTIESLKQFNDEVFKILESRDPKQGFNYRYSDYDCLIYIISSHMKHSISSDIDKLGQHSLYDSNGKLYLLSQIFDKFNNANCEMMRKKSKIFVLDGYNPNDNDEKNDKMQEKEMRQRISNALKIQEIVNTDESMSKIHFIHRFKRVIYSNFQCDIKNNEKNNNGNLLINAFCASIANNESSSFDLNDLIKQTQERINNAFVNTDDNCNDKSKESIVVYDENYIESRFSVTFNN